MSQSSASTTQSIPLTLLDSAQLQQLERNLHSGNYSTRRSRLAPRPSFVDFQLVDVHNYHLRLREEDKTIHPLYFIVADHADYGNEGVLIIHLAVASEKSGLREVIRVGWRNVDMADAAGFTLELMIGSPDDCFGSYSNAPTGNKYAWYNLVGDGKSISSVVHILANLLILACLFSQVHSQNAEPKLEQYEA